MKTYHLGINLGHDRSAAIVADGKILVAIQQERLDRHKHSIGALHQSVDNARETQLPFQAINYCLDTLNIKIEDLSSIVANMPGHDLSLEALHSQLPLHLKDKCQTIPSHHLGHAYTAFYPSGVEEALVVSVDATGTTDSQHFTESYSVYHGKGDNLKLLHSEKCFGPWAQYGTLGFIYEQVTRLASFVTKVGPNVKVPEAGKLMGLAPFGRPQPNWHSWCNPVPNSYKIDISPYDIALELEALKLTYQDNGEPNYFSPWIVDLAYKAQQEIEKALLHIVSHGLKETGLKNVCLAGGVALNSVANNILANTLNLDNIFVFPAAGDSGIAAGCALYGYHQHSTEQGSLVNRVELKNASLGKQYSTDEIEAALHQFSDNITFEKITDDALVTKTCNAIADGYIVSRFEGGSEYGPRALGNRSIIADPSYDGIQDIINARVKGRERYRPFAPVIPLDEATEVFEQHRPSPFMLLIAKIKKEFTDVIPSVVHTDGTGRFQTVTEQDNPFFFKLCKQLKEKRPGPAVILNTSFNLSSEPIVETPVDALSSFCATDMDFLAIENYWIKKKQPAGNYQDKLDKIKTEKIPMGLDLEQPSVHSTMHYLDKLLFGKSKTSSTESDGYLEKFSADVAHLKSTSSLFPAKHTPDALLNGNSYPWLNPLDKSYLVRLTDNKRSSGLSLEDIEIVIMASAGNKPQLQEARKALCLTTQEWREKLQQLQSTVKEYVSFQPGIVEENAAPKPHDTCSHSKLFGAFANPDFNDQSNLLKFRAVLKSLNYTEKSICTKLQIESLQDVEPTKIHYYGTFLLAQTPLDNLIRLFTLQTSVNCNAVYEFLSRGLCHTLENHGILVKKDSQFHANINIYSVQNLWIATDHRYQLGELCHNEQPVMYIGLDSLGLVNVAPKEACGQALDLCSGSGIQALIASRYCSDVTAIDINPRAIRFGRFNASLNGIDNVNFIEGSLYNPLSTTESFDLILANPPFVPSPEKSFRFRDGGASGEEILAKIVSGASALLSQSGRMCIVTDLVNLQVYEDKLERWWGKTPAEKLVLHTADRDEILFSVPHCHKPFSQSYEDYNNSLSRWVKSYRESGINKVNFGYIIIQNSSDSSYYSRAIHSPRTAIDQHIQEYFSTRKKLNDSTSYLNHYTVSVMPDLKVRKTTALNGKSEKNALLVPDNPYYTVYEVDNDVFDIVNDISHKSPHFSEYLNPAQKDNVVDLILKGLLVLDKSEMESAKHLVKEINNINPSIVEQETKTTPTCVSSYLS